MKNSVCYIVGASTFNERIAPRESDLLIACDGGYRTLGEAGLKPDCVLGDFDSLGQIPREDNLFVYPCEKEDTDMKIALEYGISKGYDRFYIFGGLGGRLDHTLANIQMLLYSARKNVSAYLIGEGIKITCINNGSFRFTGREKGYFSVFAYGCDALGVSIKNAKYLLNNQRITCDYALGVSNEFLENEPAEITVADGSLCILWYEEFKEGIGAENEN